MSPSPTLGPMLRFLLRRLLMALLVAATVLTLSFVLTHLSGDLAISIAGPNATPADVELIRSTYGLDRPLWIEFLDWLGRVAVGDLGDSYFFREPVAGLIARRMPVTLTVGLVGLAIALDRVLAAGHPGSGPGEQPDRPHGDAGGGRRPGDAGLLAGPCPDDRARPASCSFCRSPAPDHGGTM